jgi:hypothetical protein
MRVRQMWDRLVEQSDLVIMASARVVSESHQPSHWCDTTDVVVPPLAGLFNALVLDW